MPASWPARYGRCQRPSIGRRRRTSRRHQSVDPKEHHSPRQIGSRPWGLCRLGSASRELVSEYIKMGDCCGCRPTGGRIWTRPHALPAVQLIWIFGGEGYGWLPWLSLGDGCGCTRHSRRLGSSFGSVPGSVPHYVWGEQSLSGRYRVPRCTRGCARFVSWACRCVPRGCAPLVRDGVCPEVCPTVSVLMAFRSTLSATGPQLD